MLTKTLLSPTSYLLSPILSFWRFHPALLYGLALAIGFQAGLDWQWVLTMPILMLSLPLICRNRAFNRQYLLALALALAAFGVINYRHQFPALPPQGTEGIAYFEIEAVKSSKSPFGQAWVYQGRLLFFKPDERSSSKAWRIPCRITPGKKQGMERPLADRDYLIRGLLKESTPGNYILKSDSDVAWEPVKGSWSSAEYRFQLKQNFTEYLRHQIHYPHAAIFLAGIATGDFDDRLMMAELGRFGLQHIMAISGFHFSIIAAILCFFLRFVMSPKGSASAVVALLTLYMIFLGFGPSIMRAWLTVTLYFGGQWIEKRGSALNSLGIALIAVLMSNPFLLYHLGFQFSFLTTAAILVFCSLMDRGLDIVLRKRALHVLVRMDLWNQHGYIVLAIFRQALALTLAVNLVALPVTFLYFSKFPLLGLIYNFFFPFLVSISMLLLILALLFSFTIPPFASLLHQLNSQYTDRMLNLTYNIPSSLDFYLRANFVSSGLLIAYLTLVFAWGIWMRCRREARDWAYI